MSTARRITLSLGALVLLVSAIILPITLANAAPTKQFTWAVSPSTVAAPATGTATRSMNVTITNATPSGNSTIKSFKLTLSGLPADATIELVFRRARDAGLQVRGIEVRRESVENAFLRVLGEGPIPAATEPAPS